MSPRSNRYRSSYCAKTWSREKQQQQQQQQNKQKTKGGKGKVTGEATRFPGSSPTGRGAWERGWGGEEGNLSFILPLLLFFLLSFQLRALTRAELWLCIQSRPCVSNFSRYTRDVQIIKQFYSLLPSFVFVVTVPLLGRIIFWTVSSSSLTQLNQSFRKTGKVRI